MIQQFNLNEVCTQQFNAEIWKPEIDEIEIIGLDSDGDFEAAKEVFLRICSDHPKRHVRMVAVIELIMREPE